MLSIQRGCREESTAVQTGGKNTGFPEEHMFMDMNPYMRGFSWLDKGRDTHTHTHPNAEERDTSMSDYRLRPETSVG